MKAAELTVGNRYAVSVKGTTTEVVLDAIEKTGRRTVFRVTDTSGKSFTVRAASDFQLELTEQKSNSSDKIKRLGEKIVKAADKAGVTIDEFLRSDSLLKSAKINLKAVTPSVVAEAKRLDLKWTEELKDRTWKMGGVWNNKRDPDTEAAISRAQRDAEKVVEGLTNKSKSGSGRKPKAERDRFGVRVGTQAADINAAMTTKPQTVEEVMKKAKVHNKGRVTNHMRWLIDRDHVQKVGDDKYALVK